MTTVDRATLANLRSALTAGRAKTDAQRLADLTAVVEKLLLALEGYSGGLRSAGSAAGEAGPGITVDAQGDVTIRGSGRVHLAAGTAQITLQAPGDVTISGKTISSKADSDVALRGTKIADETTPNYKSAAIGINGRKITGN